MTRIELERKLKEKKDYLNQVQSEAQAVAGQIVLLQELIQMMIIKEQAEKDTGGKKKKKEKSKK